ncbi:MAG: hypothetical protein JNM88_00200 [Chitinophagaceae bacterium]|nr:hypothetical protein [Chitinophagaceae bacterium]
MSPTERLSRPFGTILTLQVEIFDGKVLNDNLHDGSFLFKIKSVDSIALPTPILMEFRDYRIDSSYLPKDIIELYKYFYVNDSGLRSDQNRKKIESNYVGRKFTVVGYERGEFVGTPAGVWDYQTGTNVPFHFRHIFVVIAVLSENDWRSLQGSFKN